jgi:hypothetical protein
MQRLEVNGAVQHTHTHTHTYIYIYIYIGGKGLRIDVLFFIACQN